MPSHEFSSSESNFNVLRRMLVPDWLWQLTWLRHLPSYYRSVQWSECPRSRIGVIRDLLYIFFRLRAVPEHYPASRLWERPRSEWALYYGSPYTPIQRRRFAKVIYPFDYQILFNDKVVGALLSKSLQGVRQPRIVGMAHPDEPYHQRLANLIHQSGMNRLMLKPVYGRSGTGIVLLERSSDGEGGVSNAVVVRTPQGPIPLDRFRLDCPVFLQEMVQQDPRMGVIWNSSLNTCRVITLLTQSGEVIVLGAALRFGVGDAFVDNWSAGGVAIGVEKETGRLPKFGYDNAGRRYAEHPSSHIAFENFQIPEWDRFVQTAEDIQRAIPFSRMLGLDIGLADDGQVVLIEINGLPDFVLIEQMNGPLLADARIRKAFEEYGLLY